MNINTHVYLLLMQLTSAGANEAGLLLLCVIFYYYYTLSYPKERRFLGN